VFYFISVYLLEDTFIITWDRNGSTSGPTPWQIWWWWFIIVLLLFSVIDIYVSDSWK